MKITEGWELAQGVAGYRLLYSDGSTVFIDRAPNSFELQECMIEPVMMATPPAQEDEPLEELTCCDGCGRRVVPEVPYQTQPLRNKLRKAAAEVTKRYYLGQSSGIECNLNVLIERLNDALEGK